MNVAVVTQQVVPPEEKRRRRRMLVALLVSLVVMIVVSASGFVVPEAWPQQTCDTLAPVMGCKNGAAPTCKIVLRPTRRGQTSSVDVSCPEGGGSAGPLRIFGGVIVGIGALQFFVVMGFVIASGVKATRRMRAG